MAKKATKKQTAAKNPKRQLVGKLSKILGEIDKLEKDGENTHHNYKYVTESAVSELLRKKLSENNIFVTSGTKETTLTSMQIGNGNKLVTEIHTIHTFYDGDTGEKLEVPGYGQGIDTGDKGAYKAMTGAVKYFLLKQFLVSSGDDPERDDGFNQDKAQAKKPVQNKTATQSAPAPAVSSKTPLPPKTEQAPPPPKKEPVTPRYPREHGDKIRSKEQQEQIDQLWSELMIKTSTPQAQRLPQFEKILHRDFGTKTTNFLRSKQAAKLIDNIIEAIEKLPKYPSKEPALTKAAMGELANGPQPTESNADLDYAKAERAGMMQS